MEPHPADVDWAKGVVPTPRGDIKVMDPAAFRLHFGLTPPDISTGARLAAVRVAVRDPTALVATLRSANVPFSAHMAAIVIPPDAAHGATLVFEASR